MPNQTKNKIDVARITKRFVDSIRSLDLAMFISMMALGQSGKTIESKYQDFVKSHAEVSEKDGQQVLRFKYDLSHEFEEIARERDRIRAGFSVVPRSFLVALISEYDSFLSNLTKALFLLRPELLQSSERSLTFAELSEFGTIDIARDFILEKEVESLLRKSHVEQFDWLEKKFDIHLRTDLSVWPSFVEVTEARNLCVHNDAFVSRHYLETCRKHGCDVASFKTGDRLHITPAYFKAAFNVIYEVGVKLGQVLWRKLVPTEIAKADDSLLDLGFSLLQTKRYKLAATIFTFADTTLQRRHADENFRLTFLINRALAYYLDGDKVESARILAGQDFSATSYAFQLAERVLADDFKEAAALMQRIGDSGPPHKSDYLHWPLFIRFRETPEFASAFKSAFGELAHEEKAVPEELDSPSDPHTD